MPDTINFLLLVYILDYFFLPRYEKPGAWAWVKRSLVSGAIGIILTLPFFHPKLLVVTIILILLHSLLEIAVKRLQERQSPRLSIVFLFVITQALHLSFILLAAEWLTSQSAGIAPLSAINKHLTGLNLSYSVVIRWILMILIIGKPANISFVKLMGHMKPVSNEMSDEGTLKAGAVIGFLERFLMVILISLEQFAAIGFVLTAKSIARYDKIVKDQKFGEYFLMGTLFSTLFALLTCLILPR